MTYAPHPNGPIPQSEYPPGQPAISTSPSSGLRLGLGLPLLAVPVIATVIAYVLPTLRTIRMSTEEGSQFFGGTEPVGMANYDRLFGDSTFFDGFAAVGVTGLGTVLAGAVIAPLVAWCLHQAGAAVRMAARIVWSFAVIAFAPIAMTVAWLMTRVADGDGIDAGPLDWMAFLTGVVLGAGLFVALAAFRGGTDTGKRGPTLVTAAALTAFALFAASLQTFTFPLLIGSPSPSTVPLVQALRSGLQIADFGIAGAVSTVLLAILAALGIGAALLFALARVRIDVTPGPGEPRPFRPGPGIAGILLLVALGIGTLLTLWPWLSRLGDPTGEGIDAAEVVLNSWAPALTTTLVAVVAALAGGFAIGALRPFGDGTRWLLLVFAPWLFVGSGPLAIAHYEALAEADRLGGFFSATPHAWIAVPALFVFTALFWGLEDRRRAMVAEGAPRARANGAFAAAAWPMACLVTMFVWLANAQDVVWQWVFTDPDRPTAVAALSRQMMTLDTENIAVGVAYPPLLLALFAAAMVAASVFYLPRVGIRIGR
ncbi:hypothetical protein [Glycomyces tarimensis]